MLIVSYVSRYLLHILKKNDCNKNYKKNITLFQELSCVGTQCTQYQITKA